MIGTPAFILELMPLVVPLIFIGIALYLVIAKKQKFAYAIMALATVIWFFMGVRYFHQVRNHMVLGSLTATEISQIQVGQTTLSQAEQLCAVADALRDKKWFFACQGGWADTVPLVIVLKNGRKARFRIGYYLREEGVVVEFFRGSERTYWSDGYAFCPRLPSVLRRVGVLIPSKPRGDTLPEDPTR